MAGEADKPKASAAEAIFIEALELPPAERSAYLAAACGENLQLRNRVEELLQADHAPSGFLPEQHGPPPAESPLTITSEVASLTEQPGDRIGRYKLLQKLGEGGCGVVYMAEQEEPVRRRVALKIIKLGMDTRQVVARFEAERQALALMEHPNIAKVLDAGATHTGRPFFVMELVGGVRITDYCDQNHCTTRERLELFIQVCRAVQHAHQKGVIHRDLKPSNVLVTTQDGVAVPKVIDFGIAKATQGRLIDRTVFTAFEQFLGTPAYMSPEQAQLGGMDVDTRSDIYSLGVLLYELITGNTPFDAKELLSVGLDAMRQTIREKEPVRPSTRLSAMAGGELKAAAEQRQSEPLKLVHLVRGDLDWIVMKCLEKNRGRRYETANGLARDIERHLGQQPIEARPPTALYRAQKFIQRHRVTATAVAAITTVLVAGIVVSTWQTAKARHAEREQTRLRREAQAAKQDVTEQLWRAYLSEARALRMSGRAGRHFESLAALRKAAAIRPTPELRNEAIASMVLPDIRSSARKNLNNQVACVDSMLKNYAISQGGATVSIRRLADDTELARLPESRVATRWLGFSPDGSTLLVGSPNGTGQVWDWAKPALVLEIATFQNGDFSPDGRLVCVSDATNIVLHDLKSGEKLKTISLEGLGNSRSPGWFRFSPDGGRLALFDTEAYTNVSILDARSGLKMATLPHAGEVWSVAWHPGGQFLVTGCGDRTIQVWNAKTWERVRTWRTESVISTLFNQKGDILASSGWDGYTRCWNFGDGSQLSSIYRAGSILGLSPDETRLATVAWDGATMDFFDVTFGQGLRTLYDAPESDSNGGSRSAMDSSGNLLAFRTREGIEIWDVQAGKQINVLELEKEKSLIGFAADNMNLLVTGPEGLFRYTFARSLTRSNRTAGGGVLVTRECADPSGGRMGWVSPGGKLCAIVGNDRCQIFRTDTFDKQTETGIQPGMRFSDISPDGALIASGAWHYSGAMVWDARSGLPVKELPPGAHHDENSSTVAFSPDGRLLVTATKDEYCFWEVGSWSLIRRISQEADNDFSPMMAFSRDGRVLAGTLFRNKVRLYDAATGKVLADLEAPNCKFISGLAFNLDGTQLCACESAASVRLWDLRMIRSQLAELNLDWEQPPYPAERARSESLGLTTDGHR